MSYYATWDGANWISTDIAGTSFPSSPFDGQPFFRTDHEMAYHYSTTASGWLSDSVFEATFGAFTDIAAANPLKFGETLTNLTFDTVRGYTYGFNVKCVGLSITMATSGTCDVEVFDGASAIGATARLSISGAAKGAIETLLSTTISAGNVISVGVTSGTVEGAARGVARFRRMET